MKRKTLLALLLLLLSAIPASATHMSGGEIYWDCIGPNQYRITLVVYRDCAGIQLSSNYDLQITSPCGTHTLNVTTPGGVELSQLCDLQLPNSTCNGGGLPGTQEYRYTGVITLPPCDSWRISWTQIYRNNAIANLTSPGGREMFIEAVMNNLVAPCNDSPVFTNTAIPYICVGYPFTYSYGAADAEGDSMSYQLIGARMANGVNIPYVVPHSGAVPIPGLTLDPLTGLVEFTLNQAGNWVVVVLVTIYNDQGAVIGSVMRDMQFIAYPCTNMPPDPTTGSVSGLDGDAVQTGPNAVQVCETGNFCFDMVISDPNPGNTLHATSNVGTALPGATFSYTGTNPITCHVCWDAAQGTAGFYPFIVNVDDGACPIEAFQTYVYAISVIDGVYIDVSTTNASCSGQNDGTATVTPLDGTGPYQYSWATLPATGPTVTAGAGSYPVQVTDANGCTSAPATAVITAPLPASASAGADIVACNAALPITLQGATTNAVGSQWSGGAGTFSGTFPNVTYTPGAADIAAGGVNLTLTATSGNTCPPATDQVHISLSNALQGLSVQVVNASCGGANNGSATVVPAGAGLSYLWSTGGQTTATVSGLAAGSYTVQVTDALGCSTPLTATISSPPAVVLGSIASTPESCAGSGNGTLTPVITSGTAPYTYLWSNGATTAGITAGSGSYTLQVTDANGCATAPATAVITGPVPPTANAGADLVACPGSGPIQLQGTTSNAAASQWSGGAGTFSGTFPNVTYTPGAADIAAGGVDLILTATSGNACPPATDQLHISLGNALQGLSVQVVNASCGGVNDGSAAVVPATAGLTYLWSPGGQTTATAGGLGVGSYTVTVADALNCTTTLNAQVSGPPALVLGGMTSTPESCAGSGNGTLAPTVTGGTAPYSYQWSNGAATPSITAGAGTYTVQVTDAIGCGTAAAQGSIVAAAQPPTASAGADIVACHGAWPIVLQGVVSNAQSAQWSGGTGAFSGTFPNVTYTPGAADIAAGGVDLILTATSGNACPPATDQLHISLSNALQGLSVQVVNASCGGVNNGSASVVPATAGLTYLWSPGGQTTATAGGLGVGNYTVNVVDALNCTTTLTAQVSAPPALVLGGMTSTPESCAGSGNGSLSPQVSGGTAPYSYQWSNGATTASIMAGAGTYTVQVTDAGGCGAGSAQGTITAAAQPGTANAGPDRVVCMNDVPVFLSGAVTNATGGTWSGGQGTFWGTGLSVLYTPGAAEVALGQAVLVLTTTGNPSCPPDADTVLVTIGNSFLNAAVTGTAALCNGGATGTATFSPALPGLSYLWSPGGQATPTAAGLPAGVHQVTVTDALGCDTTMQVVITQPPALSVSVSGSAPSCTGYTNGSATATVTGGTPGHTFQWSANTGGQTTATATGLSGGGYVVVATDANGCTAQASVTLVDPPPLVLAAQVPDTVCVNAPVQLTAQASGGDGNVTVTWSGIGTGTSLVYSFPTSQNVLVSVSDGQGCPGPVLSLPVHVLDLSTATLVTYGDTTVCAGGVASVGAQVAGYGAPVAYTWQEPGLLGAGPHAVPVDMTQTLTVTATNTCGQVLEGQVQLVLETPPTIVLPDVLGAGCAPLTVQFPDSLTAQNVTWLWTLGDGTTSTAPAPQHTYGPGTYTVGLTVTTPAGCVGNAINTATITAYAPPVAAFSASTYSTDMYTPTIQFTDESTGAVNGYSWSFGDGGTSDDQDPEHTYTDIGIYTVELTVVDIHGCEASAARDVELLPTYDIVIPNVFTPAPGGGTGGTYTPGDLSNDVFYPFVRFVKDYNMRIWNRWGELVFESDDVMRGWDGYYRGQLSQQDVYVYRLEVRFVDDRTAERTGDLTLLR